MDQNTAILIALTSMLSKNDIEVQQPKTIEEVIEIVKETPTGEIKDNLKQRFLSNEEQTIQLLKEFAKKQKLRSIENEEAPFCQEV